MFCQHDNQVLIILVISNFGFEGRILVLIAPVPGHCLLVTFVYIGTLLQ